MQNSGSGAGGGGGGGWGESPYGSNNGVYWVGADGQVYVKGADGTNAAGAADANTNNYWQQRGYNLIADPVSRPTGGGTTAPAGGGAARPALNQAAISNTQLTIDQLPLLLEAALAAEAQNYGNTVNEFNSQEQGQRKTYEDSTVTNQQNYDANYMDSIRSGIKGLGGLMSLLRGTGAGGGTAEDIARDTVGGVTATDIRAGADTQKENQIGLDTSLSTFLTELGRKRKVNEDTKINNERAIRRDSTTQMQDLFGKMAGYYGDAGDDANAVSWMNRAGSLTPEIAANSRAQVSAYDTTPVAVKAPELSAFAAPTQPNVVTAPGGQVGSGIFTMSDPRRRKEQNTPVGV